MDLRPGLFVTRNVRLRRPLGEGGMGTVWVGDHLALDTQVAVKFISPELSKDDPEILGRFQREAKVAARIKSQHVVQVFDHGVMDDDTPFIVMELLDGSSLAEWLALTGTLSPVDAATLVGQVAGVLGKAHELGIVHRDIKPENVFLVDSEDQLFAKVLDFGIAKQTRVSKGGMKGGMKTGTGVLVGTPDYMSPEQLMRAGEVDYKVDLWALAVVAYRALTGRCPFEGETVPAVIVAITDGAFAPPSSVSAQRLSPAIDAWFSRALSPNVEARPRSARELAESFFAAVGGVAPSAALVSAEGGPVGTDGVPSELAGAVWAPPARAAAPTIGAPARRRRGADDASARRPPVRPGGARAVRGPAAPVAEKGPEPRRVPPRRPAPVAAPKLGKGAARTAPAQRSVREAGAEAGRSADPSSSPRPPMPLDLAAPVREPSRPPRRPAARPAASSEAALMAAELAPSALLVAVTAGVSYLLDPAGMQWLTASSANQGVGLVAVAAIALGAAAWRAAVAAQRHAALSLWVACGGLVALAAGSAATASALRDADGGLSSFLPLISELAPVAAATVAAAFAVFGGARASVELRGYRSGRQARGAVMILLSLASVGLAYRIAARSPMIRDLLAAPVATAPHRCSAATAGQVAVST